MIRLILRMPRRPDGQSNGLGERRTRSRVRQRITGEAWRQSVVTTISPTSPGATGLLVIGSRISVSTVSSLMSCNSSAAWVCGVETAKIGPPASVVP